MDFRERQDLGGRHQILDPIQRCLTIMVDRIAPCLKQGPEAPESYELQNLAPDIAQ